jgi:hypothetical protein
LSAIELARRIDGLCADGRALVVENEQNVTVSALSAADLRAIAAKIHDVEWPFEIHDDQGNAWNIEDVDEAFAPFRLHIEKPPAPPKRLQVLTSVAFRAWLSEQRSAEIWWVASLLRPFTTWSSRFTSWGDTTEFSPQPASKDPRQLVRETAGQRLIPSEIGPWLLSNPDEVLEEDICFGVWADVAAPTLMRVLSDEIAVDGGRLTFRGPPRLHLAPPPDDSLRTLRADGFGALQEAAGWVFENRREAEMRHTLFSLEFARSAIGRDDAVTAFRDTADVALEGARIAYQLGLLDLSRDTLKSLADLRKAVGEDVSKTSDTTRQMITALAGALSVGMGLIAARLNSSIDYRLLSGLGIVVVGYVTLMALSGFGYLSSQARLRVEWRPRLYSFLAKEEYQSIVMAPINRAATWFYVVAIPGVLLSLASLLIILTVAPDERVHAKETAKYSAPPPSAISSHPKSPTPNGAPVAGIPIGRTADTVSKHQNSWPPRAE